MVRVVFKGLEKVGVVSKGLKEVRVMFKRVKGVDKQRSQSQKKEERARRVKATTH